MLFWAGDSRAQITNGDPNLPAKRVLMIFSETRDLPGNVLMEQGVREEMLKESTNRIEFFTENLDSGRFPNPNHYDVFRDYLKNKYAGQNLDLVMTFAARNFTLARELPAVLGANLPSVFVVANDMNVPEVSSNAPFTGIFQRFDVQGTIKFILHLQPETRRIVVIGGVSAADQATMAQIAETARSVDGVDFEFWTNRPVSEVFQAARTLSAGTVLLLGPVQRDVTGQTFYTSQIAKVLAPDASVPVYVLGAGSIGGGALGGNVVDLENLGATAGKLALLALNGTPVNQIPIIVRSNGTPMVDWRVLERWHIKPSRLPEDCVVLYRPRSLWEDHKTLIFLVGAGLLAQALTIVGLLLQRTQRRLAEAEIQRQQTELAHVARVSTMGQLTSALAHELNQPLGAILRNTEAAEIFLQNPQPNLAEVRAILADIRKDDQRAGAVIDRLRSLLKRRQLVSSRLDMREVVEDTVALARADAAAREVKLTLELPARLPPVIGDRVHLQQVLLNLILNGMDAMAAKPREQRLLTVQVIEVGGRNLRVAVSDRGTGIAPEHAAHIFEPFFTTKPDGMGMGLAISGTIIEAHGGKIWTESNATTGTTFAFTLPLLERNNNGGLPTAP